MPPEKGGFLEVAAEINRNAMNLSPANRGIEFSMTPRLEQVGGTKPPVNDGCNSLLAGGGSRAFQMRNGRAGRAGPLASGTILSLTAEHTLSR